MVYFVRSPMGIIVSGLVSIAIAAFIYFVIVKPETDKANTQVDKALKQVQPSIDQANKQSQAAQERAAQAQKDAAERAAQAQKDAAKAQKNAQPELDRATRIQNCIAKAGTDTAKLAACGSQ